MFWSTMCNCHPLKFFIGNVKWFEEDDTLQVKRPPAPLNWLMTAESEKCNLVTNGLSQHADISECNRQNCIGGGISRGVTKLRCFRPLWGVRQLCGATHRQLSDWVKSADASWCGASITYEYRQWACVVRRVSREQIQRNCDGSRSNEQFVKLCCF